MWLSEATSWDMRGKEIYSAVTYVWPRRLFLILLPLNIDNRLEFNEPLFSCGGFFTAAFTHAGPLE